ncbi:MAG: Rrf2 family transcriptional regulator [Ignavibacteriae bacterium]|nr:Rrf2 family transcriptional regulator [Ignavibacteriota bacterium]
MLPLSISTVNQINDLTTESYLAILNQNNSSEYKNHQQILMMKVMIFNKSTEYSIKVLHYLSESKFNSFVNARDISLAVDLPKEFISKILQSLTHNGIIVSQKGKDGGFKLAKPGCQIGLVELIKIFEDESFFSNCIIGFMKDCNGCKCPMHNTWDTLKLEIVNSYISDIKIKNSFYS